MKSFERFLKKKRVFSKFKRNYDNDYSFKDFLNNDDKLSMGMAFDWEKTAEGADYWLKLHKEYLGGNND